MDVEQYYDDVVQIYCNDISILYFGVYCYRAIHC